jgi:predicted alpha/beta hydrolase
MTSQFKDGIQSADAAMRPVKSEITRESIGELQIELHKIFTTSVTAIALSHVTCRSASPVRLPPLILAHGVFVNRNIWLSARGKGMGAWLARLGHDVWILETREHGRAHVRGVRNSRASFDDLVNIDVPIAIEAVREQSGAKKIFWIGHSHGGILIFAALGRYPELNDFLAGFITLGAQTTQQNKTWRQRSRLVSIPLIVSMMNYFPSRQMRLGPEDEFGVVMSEWFRWNWKRRWVNRGFDYQGALKNISAPLLCLAGSSDDMANPAGCRSLFTDAGSVDKTFRLLSRQNLNRIDYDHTSLIIGPDAENEVWPMLVSWMERHGAGTAASIA